MNRREKLRTYNITDKMYDKNLIAIVSAYGIEQLIKMIPDIYEPISEYFNNAIIDLCSDEMNMEKE